MAIIITEPHTIRPMINQVESLWKAMVLLAKQLTSTKEKIAFCMLEFGERETVGINEVLPARSGTKRVWIALDSTLTSPSSQTVEVRPGHLFSVIIESHSLLLFEEENLLQAYLPYCLLPIKAHLWKRAVGISHFAQSLDGKIATCTGDSKWIGNPENLLHAHRMRALCDGIMIGTRTLKNDRPSLTVRHVYGENPKRIVISSSAKDFSSLIESCVEPVLVLGSIPHFSGQNLNYKHLPASNGHISCEDILQYLYQEGIYSVYIEGGAETTSNFLRDGMIDIMQLHLSPQIFGSGISGIRMPEIERVSEAVQFQNFSFFPVGDSYMFVGEPNK